MCCRNLEYFKHFLSCHRSHGLVFPCLVFLGCASALQPHKPILLLSVCLQFWTKLLVNICLQAVNRKLSGSRHRADVKLWSTFKIYAFIALSIGLKDFSFLSFPCELKDFQVNRNSKKMAFKDEKIATCTHYTLKGYGRVNY